MQSFQLYFFNYFQLLFSTCSKEMELNFLNRTGGVKLEKAGKSYQSQYMFKHSSWRFQFVSVFLLSSEFFVNGRRCSESGVGPDGRSVIGGQREIKSCSKIKSV